MSDNDIVLLERRESGAAVITLNSPKVNALSTTLLGRLREIAKDLTTTPAGAVVVTGGSRIFAAGADISEFSGPEQARVIGAAFHSALNAVDALPCFTIAAISGFALGGGCELALACDYRIGSTKAVFGQPEILLGIIPGGGGTQRLPRLIGSGRAKEMMVTGRQVSADEALRIGLVDEVVEPDALMERALSLADTVASGALLAARAISEVVDAGMRTDLASALSLEVDAFEKIFRSKDSQIGVASFLENGPGKARFTGK
jgi:enoyl-CoA hydratase/carnithine racemase